MTDITSGCTIVEGKAGGLKIIGIITAATADTGDTIDMNLDKTASVAAYLNDAIISVKLQNTTGTDVASPTWNNTTGVITLPSITQGVHKLVVIGY